MLFSFSSKHKILSFLFVLFLLLLILLSPLFQYIPQIYELSGGFLSGSPNQLKSVRGRTNFLILGLGGQKNEPSSLTDTILLFSLDHSNSNHLLLSVPRDIWIPEMRAKLNSAYYYGNLYEGVGTEWSKKYVEEITGQPIHYTVVISYDGFVKIVDLLEGIVIDVERPFTDSKYPIAGKENDMCGSDPELRCRWEAVTFQQGKQTFNGQTALKFVRSRHAEGDEGSDFARAKRQQKVIIAAKERIFSPSFFLNPIKVDQMLKLINQFIETNIPNSQLGTLSRLFIELKRESLRSEVIDGVFDQNQKPSLLINPPTSKEYDNQWIIVPASGSWKETHNWVSCLLSQGACPIPEAKPTPTPTKKSP